MNNKLQLQITEYVKEHGRKKHWQKIMAGFAVVVVLGTFYALIMPASTMTCRTYCGHEEHEHTDECYERVLVCTVPTGEDAAEEPDEQSVADMAEQGEQTESIEAEEPAPVEAGRPCEDPVPTVTSRLAQEEFEEAAETSVQYALGEESVAHHVHTDECYELILICDKEEEHTHTLQCYSDPGADVETASVWEKSFANVERTGSWPEDVLTIAKTQVGYTESTENYEVQPDGQTVHGYTRYGDWYGDPYGDWCAMFCSFCLYYAGIDSDTVPCEASCSRWADKLRGKEYDLYRTAEEYEPKPGDLIFLDVNGDGKADRVGFVYELTEGELRTIEGDTANCVAINSYPDDADEILGYCELPEYAPVDEGNIGCFVWTGGGASTVNAAAKKLTKSAPFATTKMMLAVNNGDPDALNGTDATNEIDALAVVDYLRKNEAGKTDGVILEYRQNGSTNDSDWVDVTIPGVTVPGDADLRLTVNFEKVKIEDIKSHGYKMTMPLPAIMRNPIVSEQISAGSTKVGDLSVTGDTVTLTFDENWLNLQTDPLIDGYFWVKSDIDLIEATSTTPAKIIVGDVEINANFEDDIVAKNGEVSITKSDAALSREEDGDYLTYTLTVTAGEDGCPAVTVTDAFAQNTYIGEYTILSAAKNHEENTPDVTGNIAGGNSADGITWAVGDMAPGETDTLTYKVRLAENYLSGSAKETLSNTAAVFCNGHERDHDTTDFTPKARVTISKTKSSLSTANTKNGGYYIFRITVKASEDNTYTLNDVILHDALDGSVPGTPKTADNIRKWLSYDLTDDAATTDDNSCWGLTQGTGTSNPTDLRNEVNFAEDSDRDGKHNESFSVKIGSLAPGQQVSFRYKVAIDPEAFPNLGTTNLTVKNTAGVDLDQDGVSDQTANVSTTLAHKEWARKTIGALQSSEQEFTIPADASVYDGTADTETGVQTVEKIEDHGELIFNVPAGSYLYQIVANETGDWDFSSASMTDKLDKAWMEYQGYVRVDAYTMSADDKTFPKAGDSDAAVIANLSGRQPTETVWVKVDGKTGFNFTPREIGLDGEYAYLMTYYARPETEELLTNLLVTNKFTVAGTVGQGDYTYTLVGIEESVSVEVMTDTAFKSEKQAWYYTTAYENNPTNYPNGALYWVIKTDGLIPAGTQIKDNMYAGDSYSQHWLRSNSVVGIFKSAVDITSERDISALDALEQNHQLTQLDSAKYQIKYYTQNNLTAEVPLNNLDSSNCYVMVVTLTEKVDLESGESLYIVVRSSPDQLSATATQTYRNMLYYKLPGANAFSSSQSVKQVIYPNKYMYKLGYVGTYDGKTMTGNLGKSISDSSLKPGVSSDAANSAVIDGVTGGIKPGTYANWFIRLDERDNMSGTYRVVDTIPAGLEPEFVYLYSWSSYFADKNHGNRELESVRHQDGTGLPELPGGETWTEHITTMKGRRGNSSTLTSFTVYWYTDSQNRVLFDIANFTPGVGSSRGAQLIIGTRVTDENVLLGDELGEYENTAELYDTDGDKVDQSGAYLEISVKTLKKYLADTGVNPVPFYIALNPLGEDLVQGNTLTVLDTLSDNLTFNGGSIKVYEIGNFSADGFKIEDFDLNQAKEIDTGWSWQVEDDHVFKITVPDEKALLIAYDATLSALPGKTVSITNAAHWEGLEHPEQSVVTQEEYSYQAGGGVSLNTPPSVRITKYDNKHPDVRLSGAAFELQEMTIRADGTLATKAGGLTLTGTTDENGTLVFGEGEQLGMMKVNTVYRLKETKAPYGYDPVEPQYFIVTKEDADGYDPNFDKISGLTICPHALRTQYAVDIYDPIIDCILPETGGIGTNIIYTLGTSLAVGALMYGCTVGRKRERRLD